MIKGSVHFIFLQIYVQWSHPKKRKIFWESGVPFNDIE